MQQALSERFKILIEMLENGNQRKFAQKIGVEAATISKLVSGKQEDFRFSLVEKIANAYPTFNIQYLAYGIGSPVEKLNVKQVVREFNDLQAEKDEHLGNLTTQIGELVKEKTMLLDALHATLTGSKLRGSFNAIVIDLYPKEQVTHEVTLAV